MSMIHSLPSLPAERFTAPPLRLVRDENLGRPTGSVRRSSDIVMVTEGTYPHAHGGVSVWCDQLVTGLPDHAFRLVALTAFGYQRPVWDLPSHVQELVTVGLWDRDHRVRRRRGLRRRPLAVPAGTTAPLARVLAALLAAPTDHVALFGRFLDQVAALDDAQVARELSFGPLLVALDLELGRAKSHGEAVRGARASDLVKVAGMLEHLLRPLSLDPGPAAIYHASSNGLAALVCLLARRRHGAAFLLTEHGIYLRERYLELRRLAMARPAKALLLRFHRLVSAVAYAEAEVVAPGSAWNGRWEGRHGAPAHRVRPIYNGIDPSSFAARSSEPAEPVVSWLGRIDPIKDLETLVEAFAVVNAKRPDARLKLYGRTPPGNEAYRARLDSLISARGLDGVVTFEGGVAESADAYVDAQVGVLSSISEGFPYSLIEAMACGLPAVATGVGGVAEAVADTGLVVPPRAPELFGEAVLSLLDDGPRRRRLGVLARERVLAHFTLDGCLDAYRDLYAELRTIWTPAGSSPASPPRPPVAGVAPAAPLVRRVVNRSDRDELTAALGGVEALIQAVDADDIAATLESVGVTDDVAESRFGTPDVFTLAERMWAYATMLRRATRIFGAVPPAVAVDDGAPSDSATRSSGRRRRDRRTSATRPLSGDGGAESRARRRRVRRDPAAAAAGVGGTGVDGSPVWRRRGRRAAVPPVARLRAGGGGSGDGGEPPRPVMEPGPQPAGAFARGLAYVLPAVVVAAAVRAGADQAVLVASSVLGWGLAQAGGVLAYTTYYRSPKGRGLTVMRRGLLGSVLAAAAAGVAVGIARTPASGVAFALPLLHLVGATAVVMAGRTRLLLALLTPVAVLSAVVVVNPSASGGVAVGPAAVMTVAATLLLVAWCVRRAGPGGPTATSLLERADWVVAAPLALCGWLTAAFALLAVGATGHLAGFVGLGSGHWLLVALPLWLMVGTSEWLLLSLRRALAVDLEAAGSLAGFRSLAGRAVGGRLGLGLLGLTLAVALGSGGLVSSAHLSWTVAISAAAIFALVAASLFGATVLTAAARVGTVLSAMALAVVALVWMTASPRNPLGLGDHSMALCVGAAVAAGLCVRAGQVLLEPGTHR